MALKNTWASGEAFTAADQNAVATAVNVLSSGAAAHVATSETTTSTTYTDLATATDTVTVTVGASGTALVSIYSYYENSNLSNNQSFVGFAVSGANTAAASDSFSLTGNGNGAPGRFGATFILTGLTAGSTTFKMKYKVQGNTGTFANRRIAVVPL